MFQPARKTFLQEAEENSAGPRGRQQGWVQAERAKPAATEQNSIHTSRGLHATQTRRVRRDLGWGTRGGPGATVRQQKVQRGACAEQLHGAYESRSRRIGRTRSRSPRA